MKRIYTIMSLIFAILFIITGCTAENFDSQSVIKGETDSQKESLNYTQNIETEKEADNELIGLLLDVVTDIRPAENWDRLLGTDYFDMSGRPVKGSVKGPVIVREKWSEGGIRTGVRFR